MRHPQNNSARLTQVVDAVYCDLLIWRCRSLLFSCNPRLRQYVGASFRYCGFAFQFLFRPVAIKVRFSYVQFRSSPNTSWKATYKLFPIFGPKRKKKAMCNLNIPQTSFQRWYVVGEVQILLSGKKYSVILTSPIILLTLAAFFGSRTSLTVLTLTSGVPIRRAERVRLMNPNSNIFNWHLPHFRVIPRLLNNLIMFSNLLSCSSSTRACIITPSEMLWAPSFLVGLLSGGVPSAILRHTI